jgi:hypothetical protein
MSIIAIPAIWFAVRLGKDAVATDRLIVDTDTLTIDSSGVLRVPLTLSRADIAGVFIDPDGTGNDYERLRFPLDVAHDYIYSSVKGSVLPLLSREPVVPNVAIVFKAPHVLHQSRRRLTADAFAPLRPLRPGVAVPGVLLATSDGGQAHELLAAWEDARAARAALTKWQQSVIEKVEQRAGIGNFRFSATRKPMTPKQLGRWIWPPAALIGLVFMLALQGRKASYSTGAEITLAVAFVCILAGGVLDRLRRYEERSGRVRLVGMALFSVGVFIAIAVIAATSSHGVVR